MCVHVQQLHELTIIRQILVGIGVQTCGHQVSFIIVVLKVRSNITEACL